MANGELPGVSNPIATLSGFYQLMFRTADVRRNLVNSYLCGQSIETGAVEFLRRCCVELEDVAGQKRPLRVDGTTSMVLELDYEISELKRDILFFERGEDALREEIGRQNPRLEFQVQECLSVLDGVKLRTVVTDRDGTVNNYCARYLSSIQSAYNAIMLARFGGSCTQNLVILTSAPLQQTGLVEMSVMPARTCIYAGSKGREYLAADGNRGTLPVTEARQARLDLLNSALEELLRGPSYTKFALLGSGFQKKFGQTTIARQDINESVPEQESLALLETVSDLVRKQDPDGQTLLIEDTGRDIEIMLTVDEQQPGTREFDKGDGMDFLDNELELGISAGPNLICGDTKSDLPMLRRSLLVCPEATHAVFVGTNPDLRSSVAGLHSGAIMVENPDTLVMVLDRLYSTRVRQ